MRAALPRRAVAALAAIASAACGLYLLDARADERQLAGALRAQGSGDASRARALAQELEGPTITGRAASLRATAALREGDLLGAIRELRLATRERPNDWRLRSALTTALALAGDREGARRQALRTLQLNPRAVLPSGFNVRAGGP